MDQTIISADIGSSYTNITMGLGASEKLIFPTLVNQQENSSGSTLEYNGQFFACGESAFALLNERPKDPKITAGFHGSKEQTITLCYAFDRLGFNGVLDVLVRSIPYSERTNKELISKLKSETEFSWINSSGQSKRVSVKRVNIIPQGIGALRAWQHGYYNNGVPVDSKKQDVVLAEIGSCTLDIVSLRFDHAINDYAFVDECSTSNRQFNVNYFMEIFRDEIKKLPGGNGADLSYHKLSKLLIDGEHIIRARNAGVIESIDTSLAEKRAKIKFTESIYDAIVKESKNVFTEAGIVLVGGGGADLLDKEKWSDERSAFLDNWGDSVGQLLHIQKMRAAA